MADTDRRQILFEARGLERFYDDGQVQALRGVDFTIAERELISIVGSSGSGKSTLLHILGALDKPTRGELLFRGKSMRAVEDLNRFRAVTIGFVFQSFHLLPTLTAIENVQVPMFEMPWPGSERIRRAASLLEAVGLKDRAHHLPRKLSGGERQRVAIARSLANEPQVLLADEPTGNLDSASARNILSLLGNIHRERNMTIIVVTHDSEVAAQTERTLRLSDGRIVTDEPDAET